MAGLIEEFNIDLSNVEAPEYGGPVDDIYEFTLGDVYLQEGSKNHPDKKWLIFKYLLGDSGQTFSELFSLPSNPSAPTEAEMQRLGFYKQRLTSLGVSPENVNTVERDDLVGARGTFELRTTKGRDGKEYQNIKNFKANLGGASAPAASKPATAVNNPFA
jgi:hypothetical protein